MSKVLVTVDDRLLKRADRAAKSRGLTRSAYFAQLVESDLAREHGPGVSPSARAAIRGLDKLLSSAPSSDSTAAVRAARDTR
ncbi:MAG: hypothetical protein ACTHM1_08680 [Solirubrobacteraceae bacterium]